MQCICSLYYTVIKFFKPYHNLFKEFSQLGDQQKYPPVDWISGAGLVIRALFRLHFPSAGGRASGRAEVPKERERKSTFKISNLFGRFTVPKIISEHPTLSRYFAENIPYLITRGEDRSWFSEAKAHLNTWWSPPPVCHAHLYISALDTFDQLMRWNSIIANPKKTTMGKTSSIVQVPLWLGCRQTLTSLTLLF